MSYLFRIEICVSKFWHGRWGVFCLSSFSPKYRFYLLRRQCGSSKHHCSISKGFTFLPSNIIMPIMVIGAFNLGEQIASMKATLERLCKENVDKDTKIKLQNEQIIDLIKVLEK